MMPFMTVKVTYFTQGLDLLKETSVDSFTGAAETRRKVFLNIKYLEILEGAPNAEIDFKFKITRFDQAKWTLSTTYKRFVNGANFNPDLTVFNQVFSLRLRALRS